MPSIYRSEPAPGGQVRVWVEVTPGELLMLKLDAKADPLAAASDHVARMAQARLAETQAARAEEIKTASADRLTAAELTAEIARIQARLTDLVAARQR